MTTPSNSNVNSARKFGTFGGVFTPNVLTILGVIMFLRTGWVVGNAGLRLTFLVYASQMIWLSLNAGRDELLADKLVLHRVPELKRNLLVFEEAELPVAQLERRIDIWWRAKENGSLMLTLAHLIQDAPRYREHSIRVLRIIEDEATKSWHDLER